MFRYTLNLFKKGFQRDLKPDDLYGLFEGCKAKNCGTKCEEDWKKSENSLIRYILRRFGMQYLFFIVVVMLWTEMNR